MQGWYVGTSGWTYDAWKNTFIPTSRAQSGQFVRYAAQFSAMEVNACFYRALSDVATHRLKRVCKNNFRYVLKTPKCVTHHRQLATTEAEVATFWRSICTLEDRLGIVLLQVTPELPADFGWLRSVIKAFGDPSRVGVELCAQNWPEEEVRRLLEGLGCATVSVDAPHHRLTEWVTGPRAYLRLLGRRQWYADNYSLQELEEISSLVHRLSARGAREIFILFNNDIGGYSQENALTLKHMLR